MQMEIWKRIHGFFKRDLWILKTRDLPISKRLPIKTLKLFILTFRGFFKDRASLRATALTLNTLLSIVPVLALLFGISKGFGLETRLQTWLMSQFPQQQQVLGQALEFAKRAIDNTQGGLIAGAGVLFLLYSVINVIGQIEQSMNHIWSITRSRSFGRRFSDYLSLILVGPFLILGASSLNVYISTWVNRAAETAPFSQVLGPAASVGLRASPLLLLWLLFTFIYIFLPNTKVRFASGLVGGAVAALAYQVAQSLYINLQIGVSRSSAIYGSFAALPLFILWLQVSWNIMLFGAELTQQHQNFDNNESDEQMPDLSFRAVKRIGLEVCAFALVRFKTGKVPPSATEISAALRLPSRVLGEILKRLTAAKVLVETVPQEEEDEPSYQPARDPELLTPAAVVEALEQQGDDLAVRADGVEGPGEEILGRMERRLREGPGSEPLVLAADARADRRITSDPVGEGNV